ncbi:MAG: cyclase family protein, partial [Rhodospirillaceae bacterium]
MHIIDLSREIHHRAPAHPSHPPVVVTVWNDHSEVKRAGNTEFTSKSLSLSMSDHSCTHVDAPVHFNPAPDAPSIDQVPLENFYTEAICLDFGEVPNRYEATIDYMEAAHAASGEEIKAGDTVMI